MDKRAPLFLPLAISLIVVWISYWFFESRYALLDDTLIHLHYADMLYRYHFITFDGVQRGFGTSSLLYVSLLAFLRSFFSSALLAKAVSDVAYIGLIAAVLFEFIRLKRSPLSQLLLAELAVCLLSPMGIRWLSDGMETSLTNLAVVLLAVISHKEQQETRLSGIRFILLVLFGATLVFLRVELALILALCCVSILVAHLVAARNFVKAAINASPLAIGGVLAMIAIRLVMGSLLPDTALAKSARHFSFDPLRLTLQVMSSSLLLGLGTLACWIQSVFLSLRKILRTGRPLQPQLAGLLCENCAIFVVVGLSCLRGQVIQGVRYVIWPLVFGIIANALRMGTAPEPKRGTAAIDLTEKRLAQAFFLACLCILPIDWKLASHAMQGRSQTFLELRAANLGRMFAEKTIVASDVGYITYFTNGRMCDLAGLVNGRAMAAMTSDQRVAYCASRSPAMAFLTLGQIRRVDSAMGLNNWAVCGIFDFTNVRTDDRHYLIVPPQNADEVCHTLGFRPKTVAELVPPSP
ncbi:MAG: hypothetical protein JOZ83_14965 [Silvibacterium sp.]|nr:hypothetical protein [Silvibacterium sp.]